MQSKPGGTIHPHSWTAYKGPGAHIYAQWTVRFESEGVVVVPVCRKKSIEIQEQWLFVYLATGQKNSIAYWAPVWLLLLQRALCSWLLKSATAAGFVIGISDSYHFFLSILDTEITPR